MFVSEKTADIQMVCYQKIVYEMLIRKKGPFLFYDQHVQEQYHGNIIILLLSEFIQYIDREMHS